MQNYDDRIIVDDEVEIKYEQKLEDNNERKEDVIAYSNKNIATQNVFQILFSKKYLALTLSTLSILCTLFLKFMFACGVTSNVFYGIWFFLCAGLAGTALVINVVSYAKNKKVEYNVSTIITLIALFALFVI